MILIAVYLTGVFVHLKGARRPEIADGLELAVLFNHKSYPFSHLYFYPGVQPQVMTN